MLRFCQLESGLGFAFSWISKPTKISGVGWHSWKICTGVGRYLEYTLSALCRRTPARHASRTCFATPQSIHSAELTVSTSSTAVSSNPRTTSSFSAKFSVMMCGGDVEFALPSTTPLSHHRGVNGPTTIYLRHGFALGCLCVDIFGTSLDFRGHCSGGL